MTQQQHAQKVPDNWVNVFDLPDPTSAYLERFRRNLAEGRPIKPTGLSRGDYLRLIAGNVDYFLQHQDEHGAIIDPHKQVEWQYSTPCFVLAAATLVVHAGRDDLLEPAALAMDWSCSTLAARQAASHHEDFYPPQLAHALPLLKPRVDPDRARQWEDHIRSINPYQIYRSNPTGSNWNVVAMSGEGLWHLMGLREDPQYVEDSIAGQGQHFRHPWGLYTEGPMAYDHFPRLWAADLLAAGYRGKNTQKLAEMLRRAALTSLFMQSPTGELPVGGRSPHHQWNEAEQCVTYEIHAARALAGGDEELAGVFKRAAHLALGSMQRWVRPSGEMWIVKNRVDPAKRHGYEGYSAHSQYNLLAMAMLAIAHRHAEATEHLEERATPADIGGFVLDLRQTFNKVFATAGGMYIQLDVAADPHHNPTGLLRIHRSGHIPQLGPSDGLSARAAYQLPQGPRTSAAVGAAWQDVHGKWRRLAEYPRNRIGGVVVLDAEQSPQRVSFQVIYQGHFSGPAMVSERYIVTPEGVEMIVELPDYDGPVRMVWPVLEDIGDAKTEIEISGSTMTVSLWEDAQRFEAVGARGVTLSEELYAGRNGYFRLATAEYAAQPARLRVRPGKPQ